MTSLNKDLKILPQYFNDIIYNKKTFEIRKNDKNYKVGDILYLREWTGEEYTGRKIWACITYIHHGTGEDGLAEGYCVLGLNCDLTYWEQLEKLGKARKEGRVIE